MAIEQFEDIESWRLARRLTNHIYDLWEAIPTVRDFILRDQMIRASSSVMHNIAEGFDGGSNLEFARFLRIAARSCTELQSHLHLALDRKYLSRPKFDELYAQCTQTRAKIGAFIQYLTRNPRRRTASNERE